MKKPNILLIVLDSIRARNMSLYGYERPTTPFLERFAKSAEVYYQARSPGMTSLPSHTSIFTGYAVEEHQAYDSILHRIEPGHTIWEKLSSEYNYSTAVFSDNANLIGDTSLREAFDKFDRGPSLPFSRGSDHHHFSAFSGTKTTSKKYLDFLKWCANKDSPVSSFGNALTHKLRYETASPRLERLLTKNAKLYIDSFLEWQKNQETQWAACLNLMDAHHPYYPTPKFDHWGDKKLQRKQSQLNPHPWKVHGNEISYGDWADLEDLYDGSIRELDNQLEELIEILRKRDVLEETLLVITSDHGEGFGETSHVRPDVLTIGHVAGLHECLLHVPLIVSYPGMSAGKEIRDLASLVEFPNVVQSLLDSSKDVADFVPSGPVVASGSNIENKLQNKDRAAKYIDNPDKFSGVVRAVYRQDGDMILKHMTWGNDEATISIKGLQLSNIIEGYNSKEHVDRAFGNLNDLEILLESDGVDESTKQHLAHLGYV